MDRRIETLGGFALLVRGAPVPVSARKVQALLGLLATARRRSLTRSRLAGLLWEAADADGARVSLRQALAQLRRAAGPGWIEPEGEALRLADSVSVDVADFTEALARGDDAAAARLHRGAFLEGLGPVGTAAEAAIEAERARLSDLAAGAMRREMIRLTGQVEATQMAHRLLALDPLDEGAHRCLMEWDAGRGARGAARARFETLADGLRRELGVAPEAATIALMDRIRRGGSTAAAPHAPGMDSNPAAPAGPALLAVAFEGDTSLDAVVLAAALASTGACPAEAGPGEVAMTWATDGDLRGVAAGLLRAAAGSGASVGLVAADTAGGDAARLMSRARRIAALADPGTARVAPTLAARLGLAADPSGATPVVLAADAPAERPDPPFVGRAAEIAQIDTALATALAARSGIVVHLSGEAGIGKTRLSQEAARRAAARGARVIRVGFAPFATQSRSIAQDLMECLSPEAAHLPDGAPDLFGPAILAWLQGATLSPVDELRLSAMDDATRRARMLDVLAGALGRAAGPDGLVAVVEDCHWAPIGADDLLLELAARLSGAPVGLILTARPGAASGLDHRLAARACTTLVRLALAPLPEEAAAALARQVSPDRRGLGAVVRRAAGHPLFLLRLLEAGWTEGALPPTVTALVLEQIERLPPPEREALRRASIIGAAFDPADLAAIFPEAAVPRSRGDLLHGDGTRLAFGHDLIRQAIHDDLPPETRDAWHARAAAHFEGVDPIRWAEHALLARDDRVAGRAAMAAANALIAAMRLPAAAGYVESGLARAPRDDGETVAELHSARAGIRRMSGALRGALEDYRAAHGAAMRDPTRVAMLVRQALVLHRLDRGGEADRALDAAEALADGIGLSGLGRAEIHEQRGNRAFVRGDYADCLRHHAAGLAVAEAAADPRGIARAHGGLGDAHFAAGRLATAFGHFDRAVTSAERAGLGMVHQEFGFMRAYTLFFCEPGPRAHVLSDLAVESAFGAGAGRAEMIARETRAEMRLAALDLDGAREDIDRLDELLRGDPESRFAADLIALRAWLALREGDRVAAFARLEPHLEAAGADPYNGAVFLALATLAAPSAPVRDEVQRIGADRLAAGALSCAGLWFRTFTLERLIRDGQHALVEPQLEALRAFAEGEAIGFRDLLVRTAETALAGDPDRIAGLRAELRAANLSTFALLLPG